MRRLYDAIAGVARWGGAASLMLILAAGLLTVADILIRTVKGGGILGTTDLVQLLVMAAAFCAIPYGFFADTHVSVDLLTDGLPPRVLAVVKGVSALLGAVLLIGIAWYGGIQAKLEAGYGDTSSTIEIPKFYYWVWLVGGSVLAAIAACMVAVRHLIVATGGGDIGRKA
ncbi:MAG TPA: TRAP transporter small permease [Alphaproteobacteria bacterium]|nr:TRAP transporter small permease [Alphaproteobacteria bacterium]